MLNSIDLDLGIFEMPSNVSRIVESAWCEIQQFQLLTRKHPIQGFHPGDFSETFQWMMAIRESGLLPNYKFCEWGSGFAVVALLAMEIGFQSIAIESDEKLIRAAGIWHTKIAEEFDNGFQSRLRHKFESYCGSFIPTSIQRRMTRGDEQSQLKKASSVSRHSTKWIDHSAQSIFDQCRWNPDDFGLTYAYPWPGEEDFVWELFDLIAQPDSLLLTFHGAADFRLHQKAHAK